MSEQEKIEIVFEVPPSKEGSYQRTDEHGRDVRGDASGGMDAGRERGGGRHRLLPFAWCGPPLV
jgi:hypothetical protein